MAALTSDDFSSWEASGSAKATELAKSALPLTEEISDSTKDMRRIVADILYAVAAGVLKPQEAIAWFGTEEVKQYDGLALLIIDTLHFVDADIDRGTLQANVKGRDRLKKLTLGLAAKESGIIVLSLLKERLDSATLFAYGLLKPNTAEEFDKKIRRTRTNMFYKQQKFNLMREENEGYSKLVTELGHRQTVGVDVLMRNLQALIGTFALDPNRVLDHILSALANYSAGDNLNIAKREELLELVQGYKTSPSTIKSMIGFKFQAFHKEGSPVMPETLVSMTAFLIKKKIITLESVFPHLAPANDDILEEHKKRLATAKSAKVPKESSEPYTAQTEFLKQVNESGVRNQKIRLAMACVASGDIETGFEIMDMLPQYFAVSYSPLRKILCQILHAIIEPVYRPLVSKYSRGGKLSSKKYDVEPIQSLEELKNHVFPILKRIGFYISNDVLLLTKILRICKACVAKVEVEGGSFLHAAAIEDFLSNSALPSFSLLNPGIPALLDEAWGILEKLPYTTRFRMYGVWKNEQLGSHPMLILSQKLTVKSTGYVLRRISKETLRIYGRVFGKLSHSNPGTLFEGILDKVQIYSNFIEPVAEALKYLTKLSFDILSYTIVEALANPDKQRLKTSDINIGMWLASLAKFCGSVFRKYPIELTGILQYVMNKLKTREGYDLLVLKELIIKMAGIEASEDATAEQREALCGGVTLQQEAGSYATDQENSKSKKELKRATNRLREVLSKQDIGLPLVVLTAQQLGCIVFDDSNKDLHMKLTSVLFDNCQETLIQLTNFMGRHLKPADYATQIPDLKTLMGDFHLSTNAAFHILRPKLSYSIRQSVSDGDDAVDAYTKASNLTLGPVIKHAKDVMSASTWKGLTPDLFVAFWSMSLYDLTVPRNSYRSTIASVEKSIKAAQSKENSSRESNSSIRKAKKERERLTALLEKLNSEQAEQELNNKMVMTKIKQEKNAWVDSSKYKPGELIVQFLQTCTFPRCFYTVDDAIYCAKFASTLHKVKTEGWSTLVYYDRVFADITCTITSCTDEEARRYGRFLSETLELIAQWHGSEKKFLDENGNIQSFIRNGKAKEICYQDFRHVCYKWHFKITKSFVFLLDSDNYTMIRNALLVLVAVLPNFPRMHKFGAALEKRIKELQVREKGKRDDLYLMASMYFAKLTHHAENLVMENEFHIVKKAVKAQAPAGAGESDEAKPSADAKRPRQDSPESERQEKPQSDDRERKVPKRGKQSEADDRPAKKRHTDDGTTTNLERKGSKKDGKDKSSDRDRDRDRDRSIQDRTESKEETNFSNDNKPKRVPSEDKSKRIKRPRQSPKSRDEGPPAKNPEPPKRLEEIRAEKSSEDRDRGRDRDRDRQKGDRRNSKKSSRGGRQ